jgi:hypothetical protein
MTYNSAGKTAADGDSSCTLNGTAWKHPVTVWRGATYQAENAQGGAYISVTNPTSGCTPGTSGCTWVPGGFGFNASNCQMNATGCSVIADANNGMGKRVGYLGVGKGVRFSNVTAPAGSSNIIVYYTNGDSYTMTRYLSFVVNNGAAQVKAFGGLEDWSHPRGAAVTLSGFVVGSNNTISVTAVANNPAPDLDWIEVVDVTSTVPSTGLCQPSLWNVTASTNASGAFSAVDGNLTSRWTTNRAAMPGDYFQVDFTGNVNLSSITLNNSQTSSGDSPAQYAVYSSQDGITFNSTPFLTGSGTANQTTMTFPQESLRAIRIVATSSSSSWWSIGELQTNCSL